LQFCNYIKHDSCWWLLPLFGLVGNIVGRIN